MQIPGMPEKFEDLCEIIVKLGFVDATVEKTTELLWASVEDHGYTSKWDDPEHELDATDRWFATTRELKVSAYTDVIAMLVDWSIMTGRMDKYHNDFDYKNYCRDQLPKFIRVSLQVDDENVTETKLHPPVYRYLQGGKIFIINSATSGNGGGINYHTVSLEEFVNYGQKVHP